MKGIIFSIKRYAIHDGPGIRVAFFMKGCPLSCWWCHNPEGISPETEEIIQTNRIGEKEFSRKTVVGKPYLVDDIVAIAGKEQVFMEKSGGGVTFTGGEPLMQPGFLLEALKAFKDGGFHTAVDTSGQAPSSAFIKIIPYTDLFLFDLKFCDPSAHKYYTGVSNTLILKNFSRIIESGTEVRIRIPVIPGINDSEDAIDGLRSIIEKNKRPNISMINLLPYHKTGSAKYRKFNRLNRMEGTKQPTETRMKEICDFFAETGIKIRIGG